MHTPPRSDINYGLDLERTREALIQAAGRTFRHWVRLKTDPAASAAELAGAQSAYARDAAAARAIREGLQ